MKTELDEVLVFNGGKIAVISKDGKIIFNGRNIAVISKDGKIINEPNVPMPVLLARFMESKGYDPEGLFVRTTPWQGVKIIRTSDGGWNFIPEARRMKNVEEA